MVADALEEAYRRHATELIRFATVMVGPDDAADIVVDAILHVYDGRRGSGEIADPRSYLFRAVHRRIIDHERASHRRRRRERRFTPREVDVGMDDLASATDARHALGVLTVQQRTAVFLTYWCGHTPADVARIMATSEGTVRKQLARARARLREVLDG